MVWNVPERSKLLIFGRFYAKLYSVREKEQNAKKRIIFFYGIFGRKGVLLDDTSFLY